MTSNPVKIVISKRFGDARGWFTETYSRKSFDALGIDSEFVHDNHSFSSSPFTLRGLHFQRPPHGQAKLVRCVRGSIYDVAVDVRRDSPTFGRWVAAELSAENGRQLFIPVGFAHGFLTLEADCEVVYKCSSLYAPAADGGIRWDDPTIAISWPFPKDAEPTLSQKDEVLPYLSEIDSPFPYDGRPLEALLKENSVT